MNRLTIVLAATVLLASCTEGRQPVNADSTEPKDAATLVAQVGENKDAGVLASASAQKAYVDPDTGELIPRPVGGEAAEEESAKISDPGSLNDTLEVEPSPVEGGGIMIDLKGRFQNPIKATVDDHGGVKNQHPDEK
jgi:hypothetical protein